MESGLSREEAEYLQSLIESGRILHEPVRTVPLPTVRCAICGLERIAWEALCACGARLHPFNAKIPND